MFCHLEDYLNLTTWDYGDDPASFNDELTYKEGAVARYSKNKAKG